MAARAIAGLIVVGLALGIWMLWPRGDPISNTTTTVDVVAVPTTVTSAGPNASSSTSTTIGPDDHIVETVEEAEAILRELWFGWFEGIYNEDEDRIREVVATEDFLAAGLDAFGVLGFTAQPNASQIVFSESELLMSTEECISVWTLSDVSFLGEGPDREGVDIMRRVADGWSLFSPWARKEDLWQADCESQLLPLP